MYIGTYFITLISVLEPSIILYAKDNAKTSLNNSHLVLSIFGITAYPSVTVTYILDNPAIRQFVAQWMPVFDDCE